MSELDVLQWQRKDKMGTYIVKETIEGTEWRQGDGLHRILGPAREFKNGLKEWWQKGHLHREDGPAIIFPDGEKHWFQNGKRHRINRPAIEGTNGHAEWYTNGVLHRDDGPAVVWRDNENEYWLDGQQYSPVQFGIEMQQRKNPKRKLPMTSEEYIKRGAEHCPFCCSLAISIIDSQHLDSKIISKTVKCQSCLQKWTEEYQITKYTKID
jgi:hypothetical protein